MVYSSNFPWSSNHRKEIFDFPLINVAHFGQLKSYVNQLLVVYYTIDSKC